MWFKSKLSNLNFILVYESVFLGMLEGSSEKKGEKEWGKWQEEDYWSDGDWLG